MMHPEEVGIIVEWTIESLPVPPQMLDWPGFARIVGPADREFCHALDQCRPGDEVGLLGLQKKGNALVLAWRSAIAAYREAN